MCSGSFQRMILLLARKILEAPNTTLRQQRRSRMIVVGFAWHRHCIDPCRATSFPTFPSLLVLRTRLTQQFVPLPQLGLKGAFFVFFFVSLFCSFLSG